MSREAEWWNSHFRSRKKGFANLHSDKPGIAAEKLVTYLETQGFLSGNLLLEVGCGTGRNANWLAQHGFSVTGVDFSQTAIRKARGRAKKQDLSVNYKVMDLRKPWRFPDNHFDYTLEINAAHLLAPEDLKHFRREVARTLKPGGIFLTYTLDRSTDDQAKQLLEDHPHPEKYTYILPQDGLIERTFTLGELLQLYAPLKAEHTKLIPRQVEFNGQTFGRRFWWVLFRKSLNG